MLRKITEADSDSDNPDADAMEIHDERQVDQAKCEDEVFFTTGYTMDEIATTLNYYIEKRDFEVMQEGQKIMNQVAQMNVEVLTVYKAK